MQGNVGSRAAIELLTSYDRVTSELHLGCLHLIFIYEDHYKSDDQHYDCY